MDDSLQDGVFARKQIFCRAGLIAWSHRRRFQRALELARAVAGKRVLDYGCGDGTFLAMLMRGGHRPAGALGVELDERLVADCQRRFGGEPGLRFIHLRELERAEHAGAYDGVFCMEVLEHVVEVNPILDTLDRLLAPAGQLFISVPVEIGFPILIKQMARRVAGWRGLGDYPGTSPYSWSELCVSVFAGPRQHITRPLHRHPDGSAFHDHKGFNWRLLREGIARRFTLLQTVGSPLAWLPAGWASQVWLVLRKRG
jgi:SAM-dependent methyltransferase